MSKIYPRDEIKIAANNATAGERWNWNKNVDLAKAEREHRNSGFIPRKSSHKRG